MNRRTFPIFKRRHVKALICTPSGTYDDLIEAGMSLYHGHCPHAFDSDIDCMTCGKCVPCIDMVENGSDGYYPVAFFPYYHLPDLMRWLETVR